MDGYSLSYPLFNILHIYIYTLKGGFLLPLTLAMSECTRIHICLSYDYSKKEGTL